MWLCQNIFLNDFLNNEAVVRAIDDTVALSKKSHIKDGNAAEKLYSALKFFVQNGISERVQWENGKGCSFEFLNEEYDYDFIDISKLHQTFFRIIKNSGGYTDTSKTAKKLFVVLLGEWCEKNSLLSYLDLNTKIIDNKLSDKQFGEIYYNLFSVKTTRDAANYLFGCTAENKVRAVIRKEWPPNILVLPANDETKKNNNEYWIDPLADGIIKEAKKYPLLDYLLSDEIAGVYRREVVEILKRIIKYADKTGKVELNPIVSSMLQWIKDIVYNDFCPHREYSAEDFFNVCGMLAEEATGNTDYIFSVDGRKKYCKVPCFEAIKEDVLYHRLSVGWCNSVGKDKFKFAFKQYRLLFLAMYKAKQVNNKELNLNRVIEKIVLLGDENASEDHKMINFKFDTIVVFGAAFLMSLDKRNYESAINLLCEYASDFSVSNRKKQAASIYVLSYLLFENCPMEYNLREKVFDITYGHTMYPLQVSEWECIIKNSRYYRNRVSFYKENLAETDTAGNVKYQPLFFFLYHSVGSKAEARDVMGIDGFLQSAFDARRKTWFEEECIDIFGTIKSLLSFAYKNIESTNIQDKIKLAYGLQAVFYAVANIVNDEKKTDNQMFIESLKKAFENRDFKDMFFKCMYFSDYTLRKHNPLYNNGKIQDGLYLLCGCFRVTSAIKFDNPFFKIDDNMIRDYKMWLRNEKGRYLILLMRMLSYCDGFEDEIKDEKLLMEINEATAKGVEFLPYDNISSQVIAQNISNPVEWYASGYIEI